jgi:hypothetical protein
MGTKNKWEILSDPAILRAIRGGVVSALSGSGWRLTADLIDDRVSDIKVLLADQYLDGFDPDKGKTLTGYVRMVARTKTINYVQLKLHENDGAVNAMRIDATDATADDTTPRVVADNSAPLAYLRVEQMERLTRGLEALKADERSHIEALLNGETSAVWAERNGISPATANRHKAATIAKLARIVADE